MGPEMPGVTPERTSQTDDSKLAIDEGLLQEVSELTKDLKSSMPKEINPEPKISSQDRKAFDDFLSKNKATVDYFEKQKQTESPVQDKNSIIEKITAMPKTQDPEVLKKWEDDIRENDPLWADIAGELEEEEREKNPTSEKEQDLGIFDDKTIETPSIDELHESILTPEDLERINKILKLSEQDNDPEKTLRFKEALYKDPAARERAFELLGKLEDLEKKSQSKISPIEIIPSQVAELLTKENSNIIPFPNYKEKNTNINEQKPTPEELEIINEMANVVELNGVRANKEQQEIFKAMLYADPNYRKKMIAEFKAKKVSNAENKISNENENPNIIDPKVDDFWKEQPPTHYEARSQAGPADKNDVETTNKQPKEPATPKSELDKDLEKAEPEETEAENLETTDKKRIADAIVKLNPNAEITIIKNSTGDVEINSSIPAEELILPKPFYYDSEFHLGDNNSVELNWITNKGKTKSGTYVQIPVTFKTPETAKTPQEVIEECEEKTKQYIQEIKAAWSKLSDTAKKSSPFDIMLAGFDGDLEKLIDYKLSHKDTTKNEAVAAEDEMKYFEALAQQINSVSTPTTENIPSPETNNGNPITAGTENVAILLNSKNKEFFDSMSDGRKELVNKIYDELIKIPVAGRLLGKLEIAKSQFWADRSEKKSAELRDEIASIDAENLALETEKKSLVENKDLKPGTLSSKIKEVSRQQEKLANRKTKLLSKIQTQETKAAKQKTEIDRIAAEFVFNAKEKLLPIEIGLKKLKNLESQLELEISIAEIKHAEELEKLNKLEKIIVETDGKNILDSRILKEGKRKIYQENKELAKRKAKINQLIAKEEQRANPYRDRVEFFVRIQQREPIDLLLEARKRQTEPIIKEKKIINSFDEGFEVGGNVEAEPPKKVELSTLIANWNKYLEKKYDTENFLKIALDQADFIKMTKFAANHELEAKDFKKLLLNYNKLRKLPMPQLEKALDDFLKTIK